MANFTVMQNGKVKIVRGRFGGENDRSDSDYFGKSRREILSDIAEQETREEINLALIPSTDNSGLIVPSTACDPLCPFTGQVRPRDGIVRMDGASDFSLSVSYQGGRLQSAHARTERDAYRDIR